MNACQRRALSFVLAVPFLLPASAFARNKMGSQLRSGFGQFTATSNWQIQAPVTSTINGVPVNVSIVCPPSQGADSNGSTVITGPPPASQQICIAGRYLFVYEIPSPPNNSVYTFSGLAGFSFNSPSSFGVLQCDSPAVPPCTNLSQAQIDALNLGFDSLDGDLIVTVPSVPAGISLVIFIDEEFPFFQSSDVNFPNQVPTVPPTPSLNIGGAIVSPPNPRFGSQEVGTTSSPRVLTVYNSPDFASSISMTGIAASAEFSSVGDCSAPFSIASGNKCAFALSFSPSGVGSAAGTFNVTDNSPVGHEIATLNGAGNTAGVTFSPSVLVFGTLVTATVSSIQTITITNSSGPNPFTFTFPVVTNSETGLPDFSAVDHCSGSVSLGASCQVDVTFTPSFPGSISQTWVITDNSAEKSHTIELSGTAIDPVMDISTSPQSLDFGTQLVGPPSASMTYSFVNNSGGPLTVEVVSTSAEFALIIENCTAAPVAAAGSCSAQVSFYPTMGGQFTGTLTIADTAINGSLVVPLSGTAQDFTVSAASVSASAAQGGTANYSLSLTPQGGFTGTVQVSCTGAPPEANFTSCPSSVNISTTSSTPIGVSVKTTAPVMCAMLPSWPVGPPGNTPLPWITLFYLLFLLLSMACSKPRARRVLLASTVMVIGLTFVSCGGSSTPKTPCTPDPGTPTGSSTITVTVSSGNLQHTITLNLNVMP